jgi:hypothetical protein
MTISAVRDEHSSDEFSKDPVRAAAYLIVAVVRLKPHSLTYPLFSLSIPSLHPGQNSNACTALLIDRGN